MKDGQKNPAAVELGRAGGKKGGVARAAALSPDRRREIASIAARTRWAAKDPAKGNTQGDAALPNPAACLGRLDTQIRRATADFKREEAEADRILGRIQDLIVALGIERRRFIATKARKDKAFDTVRRLVAGR